MEFAGISGGLERRSYMNATLTNWLLSGQELFCFDHWRMVSTGEDLIKGRQTVGIPCEISIGLSIATVAFPTHHHKERTKHCHDVIRLSIRARLQQSPTIAIQLVSVSLRRRIPRTCSRPIGYSREDSMHSGQCRFLAQTVDPRQPCRSSGRRLRIQPTLPPTSYITTHYTDKIRSIS